MMTPDEIAARLAAHAAWLRGEGGTRLDFAGVDLRYTDLCNANLRDANLRYTNLRYTNLLGANLRDADLRDADLSKANLRDADLRAADMRRADMRGATLPFFQICPTDGAFVAFKGVFGRFAPAILTLEIPADARRTSSLVGRKCRAEYVRVLSGSGTSERGGEYVEGEIYRPDSYDDDIRVECTNGVHFFMTREEAAAWVNIK